MSQPAEEIVVGIDLGTTNSAIGIVDSGFAMLLADRAGKRVIPSVVEYGSTRISSVKRLMGARFQELEGSRKGLKPAADGGVLIETDEGDVTPEQVSAEILKRLKATAEMRLEKSIERAVITVPAYFNDAQRAATVRAGEMAGFKVERLLSEPTAAALHYGLDQLVEDSRVAVYDLGGGTFDVSILRLVDGVYEVESTCGDTALGGDDFDRCLAESLGDSSQVAEARRIKEALTNEERVDSVVFGREVTRDDLLNSGAELLRKTARLCRRAMADADVTPEKINEVVLVGGSTRMAMVGSLVKTIFEREPNLSQQPDEAIALGAAVQAGILSGAVRDVVLIDVTPLSLGIETYGGLMNVLIPRNSTIPCKAGEVFINASVEQTGMKIRVLQGEREMARDNWELGSLELKFEKAAKGQVRIGVQFALDENGMLQVLARDLRTNIDTVMEIESAAVDVSDEAVGEMVEQSVEYAFEDMGQRIFTEASLKAEELLPAVDAALQQVGDKLEADEREDILTTASKVRALLDDGSDHNALKAEVKVLDEKTEKMAALLLEAAWEG